MTPDAAERLVEALGHLVRDRRASPGSCDHCGTVLSEGLAYVAGRSLVCRLCHTRLAPIWRVEGVAVLPVVFVAPEPRVEDGARGPVQGGSGQQPG